MTDQPNDSSPPPELASPLYDDWDHRDAARHLKALFVNQAYVQHLPDGLLRLNFGESADEEPTYHTALVMSARNVLDLAQLLHRMAQEALPPPRPSPHVGQMPIPEHLKPGVDHGKE